MSEEYRIHFGFSKQSKFYPPAIELAALAPHHETRGEGEDVWHVVSLSDSEIELLHRLYLLARRLPRPKVYGADAMCLYLAAEEPRGPRSSPPLFAQTKRVQNALQQIQLATGKTGSELAKFIRDKYVEPVNRDMLTIFQKLRAERRLDGYDHTAMKSIPAARPIPAEPVGAMSEIRALISAGRLEEAVTAYYSYLGDKLYGELTSELIYLKRLAGCPLAGRDLLVFRSESSCDDFLRQHFNEYVRCIDLALAECEKAGQTQPLNLLLQHAPTMEQMIEARHNDWNFAAYLKDGTVKRGSQSVTIHNFSAQYDACPEGRIFDRYPDQVRHCGDRWIEDSEYSGLWTLYSPAFYKENIDDVGLHISSIDAYLHKSWRRRLSNRHSPEFTSAVSLSELEKSTYGTAGIRFTGRTHVVENKTFYEIDLVRRQPLFGSDVENPFVELVEELLREAESVLRERHGLPRIGEGWISEMLMFRLIQQRFADAELHAQLDWLRPQHLDCYVPSIRVGFEFQGEQHFEPVPVFGGEEGLVKTKHRDQLKAKKCAKSGVTLICWTHAEPLTSDVLDAKLRAAGTVIGRGHRTGVNL
jgi:hypothetical protein